MDLNIHERISIRKVTWDDLELIHKWWNDAKIMSQVGAKNFNPSLEEIQDNYWPEWNDPKPGDFNMSILCFDDEPIGEIGYRLTDVKKKIADFNIKNCCFELMRKGIGTFAMGCFIHQLFSEKKVNKIVAGIREDNQSGLSLYIRLGFTESRRYQFEENDSFRGGTAVEMTLNSKDFFANHPNKFNCV